MAMHQKFTALTMSNAIDFVCLGEPIRELVLNRGKQRYERMFLSILDAVTSRAVDVAEHTRAHQSLGFRKWFLPHRT